MSPLLVFAIIFIIVGLGGIGTMAVKKIPTLLKLPEDSKVVVLEGWGRKIKSRLQTIKYSSYQPLILQWLEKILRKVRVVILKIDNLFIAWIARAREKSQVWTIRSRAWMEHRRLKKKEKTHLLEKLDKAEISHELEKMKQEVAKEEDEAFKDKVENIKNGNGVHLEQEKSPEPIISDFSVSESVSAEISGKEKDCIDAIARNPKDSRAYHNLGFLYLNQKNYSDARACFRQALKINPEDEEVKRKLEEIKALKSKNGVEKHGE